MMNRPVDANRASARGCARGGLARPRPVGTWHRVAVGGVPVAATTRYRLRVAAQIRAAARMEMP